MNFTQEQKDVLVPASVGTAVFVVLDETIFRGPLGKPTPDANLKKSLLSALGWSLATHVLYQRVDAETRETMEKVALPSGAAAASFIAVNRVSAPFWRGTDRRPFAAAAAVLVAWKTAKSSTPQLTG